MFDSLQTIDDLPDISFIEGITLESLQELLISSYERKYKEKTGDDIKLSDADPYRLMLLANAELMYQAFERVEKAGKQNFLKYAYDEFLDNLAAFKNTVRSDATYATSKVKFIIGTIRENVTVIPIGTRVTGDNEIFFETEEYAEIPIGELEVVVPVRCQAAGKIGNGYAIGELSTLVDPIAFIIKVENIEISAGGTEVESDQSFAEKTYFAPAGYSTDGGEDSYEYFVRQCNVDIGDVRITSPSDGKVRVLCLMLDGSIPEVQVLNEIRDYLSDKSRRPLTDYVEVVAPKVESYMIELKYFINKSDSKNAMEIQQQVRQAIEEYKQWQNQKIGRDIIPDELISKIRNAGAKRVEISQPIFKVLEDDKKAECISESITYGGIEDD